MSQNLNSSLADYYDLNRELDAAKLKTSRALLWLVIAGVIILLYVMSSYYKRQKRVIEERVLFAEQLKETLDKIKKESSNATSLMRELLPTKYELLDELSAIMAQNIDSKLARKRIADTVTRLIDDMSINKDKLVDLEKQVDSLNNNLFSDFRQDMPGLKEADYRLYLFSVLNFSIITISLFLREEKINAVYDRKRRLKDKIKRLDEEKRNRYMSYFS